MSKKTINQYCYLNEIQDQAKQIDVTKIGRVVTSGKRQEAAFWSTGKVLSLDVGGGYTGVDRGEN